MSRLSSESIKDFLIKILILFIKSLKPFLIKDIFIWANNLYIPKGVIPLS